MPEVPLYAFLFRSNAWLTLVEAALKTIICLDVVNVILFSTETVSYILIGPVESWRTSEQPFIISDRIEILGYASIP